MAANSVNSSTNINPPRFDVSNLRDTTRQTTPGNLNFNTTNVQNVSNLIASANNGSSGATPIAGTTKNAADGSWSATQLNVRGPFNAPATNPSAPGKGSGAAIDAGFNGNAYRISGKNTNNSQQPPVIFINGINTNLPGARQTAASIANLTGANVDLVYNSSDPAVGGQITLNHFDRLAREQAEAAASKIPAWLPSNSGGGFGGMGGGSARQDIYDATYRNALASSALGREAGDWAKRNTLHNPPAAQTAANLILDQLNNTSGPVKIVGYSQGGAIASDALRRVESQLVSSYGQQKATEMMSRVRFLGLGAAADGNDMPRGVTFNGVAHSGDPVARYFGITRQGNGPGFGAVFSAVRQLGVAQHLNYVDGQGGAGSQGDPASERLLQRWYSGVNIGNNEIPNFEKQK